VRRRLVNLLAGLSLVLCVAASVLWARDRSLTRDYWLSGGSNWVVGTSVDRDTFYFYQVTGWPYRFAPGLTRTAGVLPLDSVILQFPQDARGWDWHGLHYLSARRATGTVRQLVLVLPAWLVCAALAAPSVAVAARRLVGRIRRRQLGPGRQCRTCGYDLRATPDRCPECGAVPE